MARGNDEPTLSLQIVTELKGPMTSLRRVLPVSLAVLFLVLTLQVRSQIAVFEQPGFPTIDSEEVPIAVLKSTLGNNVRLLNLDELSSAQWAQGTTLLVLPYGSAFPVKAASVIEAYLHQGGNLLVLGGQPLRVPVLGAAAGPFVREAPQDTYSRMIDFRHTYEVPLSSLKTHFSWRPGYDSFMPAIAVRAQKVFAEEGRLQGLGYLDLEDGTHAAAPVIYVDHAAGTRMAGSRIVALPFTPEPGYWASKDGTTLVQTAAQYALHGATSFQIETQYACLRPGEPPLLTLHLRHGSGTDQAGRVDIRLLSNGKVLDARQVPVLVSQRDIAVEFRKSLPLPVGTYTLRATWTPTGAGSPQEFAENGFEVENISELEKGDALGVHEDFLTSGGKPFFPVGTNYFTTEENGWDFSGPRNAAVWENDFADMQRHGVNFVRTGVWMSSAKFVEPSTGGANERFLRNLEAFLAAAHRHNIAVNFTFFAFTPRVTETRRPENDASSTPPNPYLDPGAIEAEKGYIASVVERFGKLPWLSYDLINEPSFSNPRNVFHGNIPNGDPQELAAWREWLQKRYGKLSSLADAWRASEVQLGSWQSIPLPRPADLVYDRYGNDQQVRAFDYNLFAQDMFSHWVNTMVDVIHRAGSNQLVNVGQDEGGVTNRLLNQFYAVAGVSFTTNHTYWQDDALLWDSVVAKRPGMPNITGETGYQPAWDPDGQWRYDELTGTAIEERKWALGFAAGSSGAMQWDWAREPDFGIQRSDGSAKVWESMMRDLGAFATAASAYATGLTLPEVAIILPQSFQMSTRNSQALQAQQTAVRVLYQYSRVEAYAVGEYQIDTLGTPKLILLPSAYGLSDRAWQAIEARVRQGATLLISGPFDADEHLHPVERASVVQMRPGLAPLQLRNDVLHTPLGELPLEYTGLNTTLLDRATLAGGKNFEEVQLEKGRIIFSAFPLELNSNLASVATVYDYALKTAGVHETYTTAVKDPGILICPTRLPHATLYVLTSETEDSTVAFTDTRSGKSFSGKLEAGRAALLLVAEHGELLASYHWPKP